MDLHPLEKAVDASVQMFANDVNTVIQYLTVGGRPVFTKPLSDQDRIDRYMNPQDRQAIIEQKLQQGGIEAANAYQKEMKILIAKQAKKAMRQGNGSNNP